MALLVIGLVISVFSVTVSCEPPEVEGWTLTVDRGPIAGNPDLVEYVWTTNRTPYGSYDKIAVRRVERSDVEAGGSVVFILPGTWSSGEQLVHVRKDGIQYGIPDANKSIVLYLAKRGFDVYTLDYRTHFVPHTVTDLSFMLNWGWDAWMGDMKAAVDLMKTVSGVCKIYIAGESFGGGAAMNYASVYWEEDLKGIILLDAYWCKSAGKRGGETNTYNLTEAIENMTAAEYYSLPSSGGPNNPHWANALAHPEWTELRALLMDLLYLSRSANPYDYPWSQPDPMFAVLASFDPYWPAMITVETFAYINWTDCPYLSYDFDDHYIEIDVPVIAFLSERFGYYYWGDFVNGIANPDFTGILLEGYGHLDVYAGTYVREDVNEPTYQWLLMHEPARPLTVTSSPITGVTFTIDGVSRTTSYTEWLPEGSYTLVMPETHNGYVWSHWLEDGDTNRNKTITLPGTTWTAVYTPPEYTLTIYSSPTGVTFTVDGVSRTTPWIGTAIQDTSVSLLMPEIHTVGQARYYWDQWSDGVTSRSRTVTMTTNITLTALYTGPYYQLTVTSSPITGIQITINGAPKTTPYTEWLLEDSYTLEMPETHTVGEAKYYWNQWGDGVTSRSRTVTMDTEITLSGDFAGPYYELTVASSPMTGIAFTIDGVSRTTPYTEWLPEGSYTLIMPKTHDGYVWSHWLEDGDTNRIKTITLQGTTWTAVYEPAPKPVGGKATPINIPMNKPETPTLWIWLATIILAVSISVAYIKIRKKK